MSDLINTSPVNSAGILENAELGGAGVVDLATQAASKVPGFGWLRTHLAADVFAAQTSQDEARRAQLRAAAVAAEDNGALIEAADMTGQQVVDAAKDVLSTGTKVAIALGLGVAGLALVYVVVQVKAVVR